MRQFNQYHNMIKMNIKHVFNNIHFIGQIERISFFSIIFFLNRD